MSATDTLAFWHRRRPASGSEHLISHTLDMTGARPRLRGLQTGTAAYLVSNLQTGSYHKIIGELFARTGFWEFVRKQPFSQNEWEIAVEHAPSVKEDFYTILSTGAASPTSFSSNDRNLRSG